MGLVGFECQVRSEKKLFLEKDNLDSVLKSISTWAPVSVLNLKMWILQMRVLQTKNFWIFGNLHFKMREYMKNELTSPYEI